ncbi:aldo/keto reductase [Alkalihalobacterium elongatum]|uniref:aldo/keto reductase n=1 Tax=Alkalihalobacterium elongatum TaxID=2675466 RepID=UPI001C1FD6D6|nr:aldo/keto reductase [Alkalihalobacterium elongatum]
MLKRRLGTSDLYVSEVGLGCMSLYASNEKESIDIIHAALDNGMNLLDTADLYEFGLNEELVGKAIKGKRDQVILASKVGNRWDKNKEGWSWDPSKKYIKAAVKDSLRRLQTDYIDLYQLHGGTIEDPIDETIEAFEELTKEGFIRYYGISSIRPNVIREYCKKSNIISVMMQYSLLDRRPEVDVFDLLNEHNISIIARGPLAKGVLSSNWRNKIANGYLEYTATELKSLLPKINNMLESYSMTSLALRYVTASHTVATTIPGARTMEQLVDIIQAYNQFDTISEQKLEEVKVMTILENYKGHL